MRLGGGAGFGICGGDVGEDFVIGENGGLRFKDLEGFAAVSASAAMPTGRSKPSWV